MSSTMANLGRVVGRGIGPGPDQTSNWRDRKAHRRLRRATVSNASTNGHSHLANGMPDQTIMLLKAYWGPLAHTRRLRETRRRLAGNETLP